MKPMLDKDFDQLFKSSFEDFEVAPAAESWNKITERLDKKSKTKKFPIFWMAAASVVIVLGIGIGLYTKPTEVIKLRSNQPDEMMANLAKEQKAPKYETQEEALITAQPIASHKKPEQNQVSPTITVAKIETEVNQQKNINKDATIIPETNVLTVETPKNIKPIRAKLVTEQIIEEENNKNNINASTAFAQTPIEKENTEKNALFGKKLKISSVGDLVNFVVAKVDKREEKIIKVSKTEESDNEVTGINLGLFRFIKAD